jgi:hypothetical protein
MFPSKYLKVEDLEGKPVVLKIEKAVTENLKDFNTGKMQPKTVLYFEDTDKILVLSSKINWTSVEEIAGQDSEDWVGAEIEVHPAETEVKGKMMPCIRIRPPTKKKKKTFPPDRITTGLPKKTTVVPPEDDPDDPGFTPDDRDYDDDARL